MTTVQREAQLQTSQLRDASLQRAVSQNARLRQDRIFQKYRLETRGQWGSLKALTVARQAPQSTASSVFDLKGMHRGLLYQ